MFSDAVIVPGVLVVEVELRTSQFVPQDDVVALGVKLIVVPVGPVTEMLCAGGLAVPICQPKLRLVGAGVRAGAPVVVILT